MDVTTHYDTARAIIQLDWRPPRGMETFVGSREFNRYYMTVVAPTAKRRTDAIKLDRAMTLHARELAAATHVPMSRRGSFGGEDVELFIVQTTDDVSSTRATS